MISRAQFRQVRLSTASQLACLSSDGAAQFRDALLLACSDDAVYRHGRDKAAIEFYAHADWLACGDLKAEGPAMAKLLPPAETYGVSDQPKRNRSAFDWLGFIGMWLCGFGSGALAIALLERGFR